MLYVKCVVYLDLLSLFISAHTELTFISKFNSVKKPTYSGILS